MALYRIILGTWSQKSTVTNSGLVGKSPQQKKTVVDRSEKHCLCDHFESSLYSSAVLFKWTINPLVSACAMCLAIHDNENAV